MSSTATPTPEQKSALLWGVVGALCFLVFHQAYLLLLDGQFLGVAPVAGVALAVFAVASVASYYVSTRFGGRDGDAGWQWGDSEESADEERPEDGSE